MCNLLRIKNVCFFLWLITPCNLLHVSDEHALLSQTYPDGEERCLLQNVDITDQIKLVILRVAAVELFTLVEISN